MRITYKVATIMIGLKKLFNNIIRVGNLIFANQTDRVDQYSTYYEIPHYILNFNRRFYG